MYRRNKLVNGYKTNIDLSVTHYYWNYDNSYLGSYIDSCELYGKHGDYIWLYDKNKYHSSVLVLDTTQQPPYYTEIQYPSYEYGDIMVIDGIHHSKQYTYNVVSTQQTKITKKSIHINYRADIREHYGYWYLDVFVEIMHDVNNPMYGQHFNMDVDFDFYYSVYQNDGAYVNSGDIKITIPQYRSWADATIVIGTGDDPLYTYADTALYVKTETNYYDIEIELY